MGLLFDVSMATAAPCHEVWALLTDTRRWPEWGPSVRAVECAPPVIGPGSTGRVLTALGVWLPFEVSEWAEGRRWSWRVAGVPATGHRVEPLPDKGCRIVFEVPLVAAPYAFVCRMAAARIARIAARRY